MCGHLTNRIFEKRCSYHMHTHYECTPEALEDYLLRYIRRERKEVLNHLTSPKLTIEVRLTMCRKSAIQDLQIEVLKEW